MSNASTAAIRPGVELAERNLTLASLSLAVLLSSIGTSIANVAVPSLGLAFDASFQQVQWVVIAYLLAATCLIVIIGSLGDRFGRARLLRWGALLFTAASVACAAAPTLPLLIAARALQGVGAAIMMTLALAMTREIARDGQAGRALGLLAAMSAVGTALGPTLGGILLEIGGWRAVFAFLAPAGAAGFLLLHRHLPRGSTVPPSARARFDVPGALLLAVTLAAYALSMTTGGGEFGAANAALLSAAAVGAALFVLVERRSPAPLVALASFRDRRLVAGLAANVAVSTVMMATLLVGPFYLSRVEALGPAGLGAAMSVGPLLVALTSVPSGLVADRLGGRASSVLGLAAIAAGAVVLAVSPIGQGLIAYLLPVAVMTLGYALFQTANSLVVMTGASREASGAMSGLLNLSRNLGLISGASLMGAVFASAAGPADLSAAPAAAIAFGMRATFAVATVLVVVAMLAMLAARPRSARFP